MKKNNKVIFRWCAVIFAVIVLSGSLLVVATEHSDSEVALGDSFSELPAIAPFGVSGGKLTVPHNAAGSLSTEITAELGSVPASQITEIEIVAAANLSGAYNSGDWQVLYTLSGSLPNVEKLTISGAGVTVVPENAMYNSVARQGVPWLRHLSMPDVVTIGNNAFRRAAALAELELPNVVTISDYGFAMSGDPGDPVNLLTAVNFPNVTSIGQFAFTRNENLASVSMPKLSVLSSRAFSFCIALENVSFPLVTAIGDRAFYQCKELQSASFPAATTIGLPGTNGVFEDCFKLTSVELPEARTIGIDTFWNCYALPSISLPQATSIGAGAFRRCFLLTSVELPEARTLGNEAFRDCHVLPSISLPQVTSIGTAAFRNGFALTSVELPEVQTLGNEAFRDCRVLPSISLPQVTSIGTGAFQACDVLATYRFGASVPTLAGNVAASSYASPVYITRGAVSDWQNYYLSPLHASRTVKYIRILTAATPANGSSDLLGGEYFLGDALSVTAVPDAGYTFQSWRTSPSVSFDGFTSNPLITTVPDADIAIEPIFDSIIYSITVQPSGNGSGFSDLNTATVGRTVTLTALPAAGYIFDHWVVVSGGISLAGSAQVSFSMPAQNVIIRPEFVAMPPSIYSISVQPSGPSGNGNGFSDQNAATAGTTITLKAVPDAGYVFDRWVVVSGGISLAGSAQVSFSMPAQNVIVRPEFVAAPPSLYSVTVQPSGPNGNGFSDLHTATAGTTVTLRAVPNPGCHFNSWVVVSGNAVLSDPSKPDTQFTMPAGNVVLKALFEVDPSAEFAVSLFSFGGNGRVTSNLSVAKPGDLVVLTATADYGYQFASWIVPSVGISLPPTSPVSFTMPGNNVSITAVFEKKNSSGSGTGSSSGGGSSNADQSLNGLSEKENAENSGEEETDPHNMLNDKDKNSENPNENPNANPSTGR